MKGPRPILAAVVLLASDGTFFCCKIYLIHEHKQRTAEKSQKVKLQNNGDVLLLCERIIMTMNDNLETELPWANSYGNEGRTPQFTRQLHLQI